MNSNQIVLEVIRAMAELNLPYMLVGSYSSNLYGRPRSTKDADFVIQCSDADLKALRIRLGPRYRFDPQMSFESVTGTMRYIMNFPPAVFKIELFLLSEDPHDQARFQRRQRWMFENQEAWLPSAEDVVITKLRWSRLGQRYKDVDDVRDVLSVQLGKLDLPYIRRWCDQHGTSELFEQLLKEAASAS